MLPVLSTTPSADDSGGYALRAIIVVPFTQCGGTPGSVDYMAPEQAHGADVDGGSDIYSHLFPGFPDVLDRALAKQPGDRQQSATQLAQDATDALRAG